MSDLPMEFELNRHAEGQRLRDRPINANHLRASLAEIEVYSEEQVGDEPQR